MGLPNLMIDSNGVKTEAPKYLEKSAKRLRKEQQNLARKKKYDVFETNEKGEIIKDKNGKEIIKRDPNTNKKIWKCSKNRDRQVEKLANVHIHIANQRRNYDHVTSKEKVKCNELNAFEKLPIQKMMKDRIYAKRIADAGWGQTQRFTVYKAEWAGKMTDFVDPANTSQSCSRCGRLVGKMNGDMFHDPLCGLEINVHESSAKNVRNRSPIYQQRLDEIYQRLSPEMKEMIKVSEKKISGQIYCWSLDPQECIK